MGGKSAGEKSGCSSSAQIARRVTAAVEIQRRRFKGTGIRRNALLPAGRAAALCNMSAEAEGGLVRTASRLGFSGRAYHGVLRVARTIADLAGREIIEMEDMDEAIRLRRLGEDPWDILSIQDF